jgi:hypothetical protein
LIRVAWSYDDDGDDDVCSALNDGDLGDDRETFTTTDTVTDVAGVAGQYNLCLYSNGKPGTATIAVVANGVTLAPVTITVVGDIASITVVADGTYVAEDNEEVSNFFTVTAKDSAGTVINGPNTGVAGGVFLDTDYTFDYAEDNAVNQQDDDIDFIGGAAFSNNATLATGVLNYSYNQHALLAESSRDLHRATECLSVGPECGDRSSCSACTLASAMSFTSVSTSAGSEAPSGYSACTGRACSAAARAPHPQTCTSQPHRSAAAASPRRG